MRIITTADECAGLDWEILRIATDYVYDDDEYGGGYGQIDSFDEADYKDMAVWAFEDHNDVELQGDAYDYFCNNLRDYYKDK